MLDNERKYTVATNPMGQEVVFYEENGFVHCFLTTDPSNSDYQQYLAWLNGEAKGDLIS